MEADGSVVLLGVKKLKLDEPVGVAERERLAADIRNVQCPSEVAKHDVPSSPVEANLDVQCNTEVDKNDVTCSPEDTKQDVMCSPEDAPCSTEVDNHDVSCSPEYNKHGMKCSPEAAKHEVPCSPEISNHDVPCTSEADRHEVVCSQEDTNENVPYSPAVENNDVPSSQEAAKHAKLCTSEAATHVVSCNPEAATHDVPCNPEAATHVVPCNPEAATHVVPCNPEAATYVVPCNPEAATHDVPRNSEGAKHDLLCSQKNATNNVQCPEIVIQKPEEDSCNVVKAEDEHEQPERDQWSSDLDFILACVGLAVGLGNIWRFPYLCYKNGGGAFLIPYLICLFTCGVPVFMLELAVGQYMSIGSLEAWARFVPAFKGIGIATCIVVFLANLYYIVILAWAVYYLVMSFTATLPWSHCNNDWNTDRCYSASHNVSVVSSTINNTNGNATAGKTVDPVIEFWERKILHISNGVDVPGGVVWELAVSLLVCWILVYFSVWRGVKWSGKVVYFTALFPYVILTILLIRGITLDGAGDGIYFYLKPDFSRLLDPQVWIDGGTQILYSFDLAIGALVTLGSYSKFNNNFYRDTFIITTINSGTSFFAGFAVFSVLGYMAKEQNTTIAEVATQGPGLVFLTYPKAVTQLPFAPVWAVLFFIMIILVGIDSQFVAVEGFLTPMFDAFPSRLYSMKNRMILTAVYCAISYIIGLSMITEGGMFVFQLFDFYCSSGLVLLWIIFFEAVVVSWAFGSSEFQEAVQLMIGRKIPVYFMLCWKYITPAVCLGIFLFMVFDFVPLTYDYDYVYPDWAQGIGICMGLVSMICIPLAFFHEMWKAKGTLRERWRKAIQPVLESHQIPPGKKPEENQDVTTSV